MVPWIGGGGLAILCLILRLLIFGVGVNDPLGKFCFIVDDKTCVGQGETDLCMCMGVETGATNLLCFGKVGDVIPLGT